VNAYEVKVDGGEGGTTRIEMSNVVSAIRFAESWARSGEWAHAAERNPDWNGCAAVSVQRVSGKRPGPVISWSEKVYDARSVRS